MLILPDKCEVCGLRQIPTQLKCDKCDIVYNIEDFNGIVVRFASRNECIDCDDDNNCDTCDIDSDVLEFQFCNVHCLAEFVKDPLTNDRFLQYDSSAAAIFLDPESARLIFYSIGSTDW